MLQLIFGAPVYGPPPPHIKIRILEDMSSGIQLRALDLEPECKILVFLWSFGPPFPEPGVKLFREILTLNCLIFPRQARGHW